LNNLFIYVFVDRFIHSFVHVFIHSHKYVFIIFFLMVYLLMWSVAQFTQHWIILLVNNKLQQILKKVMSSLNVLFWYLPGQTMEHHVNICRDSWCPHQESNWAPSKYRSQALPLSLPAWFEFPKILHYTVYLVNVQHFSKNNKF